MLLIIPITKYFPLSKTVGIELPGSSNLIITRQEIDKFRNLQLSEIISQKSGINSTSIYGANSSGSKTTIDIRKKGISPKSGYIATGSTKPLIHTGRLRDSIKPKKGGVELFRYGAYHNAGYKTTHNAFTGRYFKETGVQIANQNVPARPFIDRGILMKTKEKEEVFKNFSRAIKQSLKK